MTEERSAKADCPFEDYSKLDKARQTLRHLGEMLEESAYESAGSVDSTQVARILSMSHEVAELAERLRPADL